MSSIISVSQTPTITASSAYASGNALGGLLTFTGLLNGGFSKLITAVLLDKGNQKAAIDLLLFATSITATADKSAIAISGADLLNLIGRISFATADYSTIGSSANAEATERNLQLALVANASSKDNNVYGQLVCRGTPTYASTSDLSVLLAAESVRG